jgi:hypothetical protein
MDNTGPDLAGWYLVKNETCLQTRMQALHWFIAHRACLIVGLYCLTQAYVIVISACRSTPIGGCSRCIPATLIFDVQVGKVATTKVASTTMSYSSRSIGQWHQLSEHTCQWHVSTALALQVQAKPRIRDSRLT